jgi:hypothetical protein
MTTFVQKLKRAREVWKSLRLASRMQYSTHDRHHGVRIVYQRVCAQAVAKQVLDQRCLARLSSCFAHLPARTESKRTPGKNGFRRSRSLTSPVITGASRSAANAMTAASTESLLSVRAPSAPSATPAAFAIGTESGFDSHRARVLAPSRRPTKAARFETPPQSVCVARRTTARAPQATLRLPLSPCRPWNTRTPALPT